MGTMRRRRIAAMRLGRRVSSGRSGGGWSLWTIAMPMMMTMMMYSSNCKTIQRCHLLLCDTLPFFKQEVRREQMCHWYLGIMYGPPSAWSHAAPHGLGSGVGPTAQLRVCTDSSPGSPPHRRMTSHPTCASSWRSRTRSPPKPAPVSCPSPGTRLNRYR